MPPLLWVLFCRRLWHVWSLTTRKAKKNTGKPKSACASFNFRSINFQNWVVDLPAQTGVLYIYESIRWISLSSKLDRLNGRPANERAFLCASHCTAIVLIETGSVKSYSSIWLVTWLLYQASSAPRTNAATFFTPFFRNSSEFSTSIDSTEFASIFTEIASRLSACSFILSEISRNMSAEYGSVWLAAKRLSLTFWSCVALVFNLLRSFGRA
mgnify:CR=1 FL=1